MSNISPEVVRLTLPSEGFLRLNQIIGSKGTPAIIPISKSAWYLGQKTGRYPLPISLSTRTKVYPVESIRALIKEVNGHE
jgi:hypothetical protein